MFESFVCLGVATLFLVALAVYADRNREDNRLAIRGGLPSAWLGSVAEALDWDFPLLSEALAVDPGYEGSQGLTRRLTVDESGRLLALVDLITLVHDMVERSGDPEGFSAGYWLGQWLRSPCPAYGGRRPMEYLNSSEGLQLVRQTLQQMQSGTYA